MTSVKRPPRDLTPEELDALVHSDFATFARVTFSELNPGQDLMWAPYLAVMASRLEDIAHSRRRRLIITLPPRHLKSFMTSVALPAYVLGHHPSQDIMVVSYGADLAKELARQTYVIMSSDLYRDTFGEVLLDSRQSLFTLRTTRNGVRRATSMTGTATGVGGDLLIFDDPQKPGETLSEAVRRSTNSAYENTFATRGNLPGRNRTIIVMQRLHEDDFVGHVTGLGGEWDILNFPAIAEQDETLVYRTIWGPRTFRRRAGDALHPERVPVDVLEELRQQLGEAAFAAQYQQRPAPAKGGVVDVGWFRSYKPEDLPKTFERTIQSWDTASKAEEWHDYSVCTTWGVTEGRIYLLNVFRERLQYPALKRAVRDHARRWGAGEVHIEDKGSGTQLIQDLRAENLGEVRGQMPVADKVTRMINQTAAIEKGNVYLPAEAPWLAEYRHELAVFPNGKYDDQVDSTSQALAAWRMGIPGFNVMEFYRQEHERRVRPPPPRIVLVRPCNSGANVFIDIEGHTHHPGPDGLFRLPEHIADMAAKSLAWEKVNPETLSAPG